jgi:gamma-glutamyltranspeptidase/glutathione hydrolase
MEIRSTVPDQRRTIRALACASALLAVGAATLPAQTTPRPEQRVEARNGVVAASHPAAARAGVAMLEAGGNAVDAAVATAFALGVVEPMMGGVGGGGALTMWLAETTEAWHVEFYASAPGHPDYGLDSLDAAAGVGGSITAPEQWAAVPGTVAGLLQAHERYGRLPRERVLEPAIRLAAEGFRVHPFLAQVMGETVEKLQYSPDAAAIFVPGGELLQAGDRLVQAELAHTLELIARDGRDGYYRGPVADEVVATLRSGGNTITLDDLAEFAPRWRRPLCGSFRGYSVLAAPPPLAGVQVLEALNLIESLQPAASALPTEDGAALGILVDAVRIARADAAAWVGDPRDVGVPAVGLAGRPFAAQRSDQMGRTPVPDTLLPGDPWAAERMRIAPACPELDQFPPTRHPQPQEAAARDPSGGGDEGETTHLSVVDGAGNEVSLTFTLGAYFGYGAWAAGAFFNDANENFGGPVANRRGPYRTPRTQTAPAIVVKDDRVKMVVGSPGGGRIAPAIVQAIVYTLVYGLDPWTALHVPRFYPAVDAPEVHIEVGFAPEAAAALRARGYTVNVHLPYDRYFGGLHVVVVADDGTLIGAADPRRGGAALGY